MINTKEIIKGVFLHHLTTEKFQSQNLKISFTTKITKESASMFAILPYVLTQGSMNFQTSSILQNELKRMYGTSLSSNVTKKGEFHTFSLHMNFINDKYTSGEDLLLKSHEILMDLIFEPLVCSSAFDENIVLKEKNNLIDLINSQVNDKIVYANTKMCEHMCKNEPYSLNRFGTVLGVENITPTSLYEFYVKILNESRIDITYIGNKDPNNLDFTQFTERLTLKNYDIKRISSVNAKEIIETENITQGKLSIGFRTNTVATDEDYPALVLLNTVLGGSTGSKLFRNVREKMSLCYYASSYIDKVYGILNINSGIEVKDFEIAKNAILREFYDIQNGEITSDEIESAKLTVINTLTSLVDEPQAIIDYYFTNALIESNVDVNTLLNDVKKVSKSQIVDVSKKVILDTIYFLKGEQNENV